MNQPPNPQPTLKRDVATRWLASHDPKHKFNQLKKKWKKQRDAKATRSYPLR